VAEKSKALTGIVKAGYSPFEQYATDSRLQGPWTDLYALGATLYCAVTGYPPEEATLRISEDRMPIAAKAAGGRYRPEFLQAIDAGLKARPADRPRSVAQLRPMLVQDQPSEGSVGDRLSQTHKTSLPRGRLTASATGSPPPGRSTAYTTGSPPP